MMRTTVRTGQGTIVHEGCAATYDHESGDLWIVDEQGGVDTEYRAGDYLFVTIEVVDPDEANRFEFIVDGVFDVMDRGTVLAGVVASGEIAVGDPILLEDGQEVIVRGIEMQGMKRGPGTKLGLLIGNQHGSTVIRIGAHVVQP